MVVDTGQLNRQSRESSSRIAKNTAVLLALRVGMPILAIGLVIAVSRILGTDGLGRYTLAFSYLYLFNALGPLGLYALLTRDGAREPEKLEGLLADAVTMGSLASVVLTVAMFGLAVCLDYDPETRTAIGIVSLAIWPFTVGNLIDGAFAARERMELMAAAALTETGLKVVAGIAVLFLGFGLQGVLVVVVLARFLGTAMGVALLPRIGIRLRLAWDPARLRQLGALAPTFLLISIFATLYWRVDVLMLSKLRPMEDVGFYGAAWRILDMGLMVPKSFCLALYPQIAALAIADTARLRRLGDTALRYLVAMAVLAAVSVSIVGKDVLTLLYGAEFAPAVGTLVVLLWTLVPYGWVRYHAYVLVGANHQRIDLALNIIMLAINVALNWILIPRYGHYGAACATLTAICLYGVAQHVYLYRNLPEHLAPPRIPLSVFAAGLATAAVVYGLSQLHVLVALAAAPVVYLSMLATTGFFSLEELKLLRLDRWETLYRFVRRFVPESR